MAESVTATLLVWVLGYVTGFISKVVYDNK